MPQPYFLKRRIPRALAVIVLAAAAACGKNPEPAAEPANPSQESAKTTQPASVSVSLQDRARQVKSRATLEVIANSVLAHRLRHSGRLPSSLHILKSEGLLTDEMMEDAWGTPFQYRRDGVKNPSSFDVYSAGPDKTSGTDDDFGNWISGT